MARRPGRTSPSKQDQCLRDMVDAIREILGLTPLYFQDSGRTKTERMCVHIYNDRSGMTPRRSGHL